MALVLFGLDVGGSTEASLRIVRLRWDVHGTAGGGNSGGGSKGSSKPGSQPAVSSTRVRSAGGGRGSTSRPRTAAEHASSLFVGTSELPPPLPPPLLRQFAAATATADFRHDLVKAMRWWRRGIPTLVLTNATGQLLQREQEEGLRFNEVWQHYPDVPAFRLTGKPGDPRAAATPALAQAALGSGFSWLLYGDDDVAFFWPGLLRALHGLHTDNPYFLTDNYYSRWPTDRPGQHAPDQPRCVPCSLDTQGLDLTASHALKTCNCSVAAMAEAFRGLLGGRIREKRAFKSFPRRPPITTVAGGGGAVFSAGLLRRLDSSLYESCVHGHETKTGGARTCGGSDGLLTACMWQQGFGYTDPGLELRHRGTFAFNTYRSKRHRMEADLRRAVTGGCGTRCRLRLGTAVSLHANGAEMTNYTRGAADLARLLRAAAKYAEASAPLEQLASGSVT